MEPDALVSADSHVVEPGDLWTARLPRALRERAPRAQRDPRNHHVYFALPGASRGLDLTLSVSAGLSNAEVDAILASDPTAMPGVDGGWDPHARLADLAKDGIVADVLYPTCGLSLLQLDDSALQEACFRVYNDWLAEFCAVDTDRLVGLALLACWDVDVAVRELERARGLGLRGGIIWTAPPQGESFFDPRYEPLWSAAEALGAPLHIHTLGGQRASREVAGLGTTVEASFHVAIDYRLELQRSLCELVASGVFARHPALNVVGAEAGMHFLAEMERRLDSSYRGFWARLADNQLVEPPSHYLRRNVWLTYISDPVGLRHLDMTGAARLMWSGDYPHGASTWPNSRETVAREHAGVATDAVRRLTFDNCTELYGLTARR
jgi:predicted TIM-barrel fold metal-dependent hydrolase